MVRELTNPPFMGHLLAARPVRRDKVQVIKTG